MPKQIYTSFVSPISSKPYLPFDEGTQVVKSSSTASASTSPDYNRLYNNYYDTKPKPTDPPYWPTDIDNAKPKKKQRDIEVAHAMPNIRPSLPTFTQEDNTLSSVLRESLIRAFDEGTESPYDLKDSIIDGIERDIQDRVLAQLEAKQSQRKETALPDPDIIVKAIDKHLPAIIKECLKSSTRCYLAGSRIVRLLTRPKSPILMHWRNTDWDLFVHKDDAQNLPVMHNGNILEKGGKYDKFDGGNRISTVYYTTVEKIGLVNVIAGNYNKLEEVLQSFDFQFLQMGAFYNADGQPQFAILTAQAWYDLMHNIIRFQPKIGLNSLSRSGQIESATMRVAKYVARGFRDCTGLCENGVLGSFCSAFSNTN